jgi:hypothetical protein
LHWLTSNPDPPELSLPGARITGTRPHATDAGKKKQVKLILMLYFINLTYLKHYHFNI